MNSVQTRMASPDAVLLSARLLADMSIPARNNWQGAARLAPAAAVPLGHGLTAAHFERCTRGIAEDTFNALGWIRCNRCVRSIAPQAPMPRMQTIECVNVATTTKGSNSLHRVSSSTWPIATLRNPRPTAYQRARRPSRARVAPTTATANGVLSQYTWAFGASRSDRQCRKWRLRKQGRT